MREIQSLLSPIPFFLDRTQFCRFPWFSLRQIFFSALSQTSVFPLSFYPTFFFFLRNYRLFLVCALFWAVSKSILKRTLSFRLLRFSEISKAPYHLNCLFLVLVGLLCIFFLSIYPEGKGNPLQYSCLENPMDRGTWRATVHGVARVGHD